MTLFVDLQLATTSHNLPPKQAFIDWVRAALRGAQYAQDIESAEVSIRIVDTDESQALNYQYRQKNNATNVLSFPTEFPPGVPIDFLGDLVICAPVVFQEATEQSKAPLAHWAHMVIHGTLHLLGFDHIDDKEAEQMESLETQLLESLGYPCPYY
jgi:probable rRNA maturation factor